MPSSRATDETLEQRQPDAAAQDAAAQDAAARADAPDRVADAGAAARAAELAVELERLRDRYLRARADLENYRRRAAEEGERRATEYRDRLLGDWLEVVDSVDRALQLDQGRGADDGLRAVLRQMESVLSRHGVERVEAYGEPFDPQLHDAIAVQAREDVPARTVLDVARAGYRVGDRVLRPAQVVVSRRAEEVSADGDRDA